MYLPEMFTPLSHLFGCPVWVTPAMPVDKIALVPHENMPKFLYSLSPQALDEWVENEKASAV